MKTFFSHGLFILLILIGCSDLKHRETSHGKTGHEHTHTKLENSLLRWMPSNDGAYRLWDVKNLIAYETEMAHEWNFEPEQLVIVTADLTGKGSFDDPINGGVYPVTIVKIENIEAVEWSVGSFEKTQSNEMFFNSPSGEKIKVGAFQASQVDNKIDLSGTVKYITLMSNHMLSRAPIIYIAEKFPLMECNLAEENQRGGGVALLTFFQDNTGQFNGSISTEILPHPIAITDTCQTEQIRASRSLECEFLSINRTPYGKLSLERINENHAFSGKLIRNDENATELIADCRENDPASYSIQLNSF